MAPRGSRPCATMGVNDWTSSLQIYRSPFRSHSRSFGPAAAVYSLRRLCLSRHSEATCQEPQLPGRRRGAAAGSGAALLAAGLDGTQKTCGFCRTETGRLVIRKLRIRYLRPGILDCRCQTPRRLDLVRTRTGCGTKEPYESICHDTCRTKVRRIS
jgi:hypothetical protein